MASLEDRKIAAVRRYVQLHEKLGRQQQMMLKVQTKLIKAMPVIARARRGRQGAAATKNEAVQTVVTAKHATANIYEELSRRERQTLELALKGDSEKQIARKLKLSRHTVHLYVTALYKHFRVHSRGELLAYCLTRSDEKPST